MRTSKPTTDPRAIDVLVDPNNLTVELADGRRVSVPLAWFPRLLNATKTQRNKWELLGDGHGIRWPEIDEDLSVDGLLRGTAAPHTKRRAV